MKIKKEMALLRVLSGSRMYGTQNESSDFDYKMIALPPLSDLILMKRVGNNKVRPEGLSDSSKMLAGETETEIIPFQTFMRDFFDGQTYALEIAFAVKAGNYEGAGENQEQTTVATAAITEMLDNFLTNNVSKMVGYAITQARAYGLKTQRYTAVKDFVEAVTFALGTDNARLQAVRVGDDLEFLDTLLNKYVTRCEIENARGGSEMAPAIDVAGKKFPLSNTWYSVIRSMQGTLDTYGDRVKGFGGEKTDWKALSHAIRVTEQILELAEFGHLVFPRPNALYLKYVKEGQVALEDATAYLNDQFSKVTDVVDNSTLQHRTPELEDAFEEFMLNTLAQLYGV